MDNEQRKAGIQEIVDDGMAFGWSQTRLLAALAKFTGDSEDVVNSYIGEYIDNFLADAEKEQRSNKMPHGRPVVDVSTFPPDWHQIGTDKELEQTFSDFKFTGPGWYLTKMATMLVVYNSLTNVPWLGSWAPETRFTVFVWHRPGSMAGIFNAIVQAPVRSDRTQDMSGQPLLSQIEP